MVTRMTVRIRYWGVRARNLEVVRLAKMRLHDIASRRDEERVDTMRSWVTHGVWRIAGNGSVSPWCGDGSCEVRRELRGENGGC